MAPCNNPPDDESNALHEAGTPFRSFDETSSQGSDVADANGDHINEAEHETVTVPRSMMCTEHDINVHQALFAKMMESASEVQLQVLRQRIVQLGQEALLKDAKHRHDLLAMERKVMGMAHQRDAANMRCLRVLELVSNVDYDMERVENMQTLEQKLRHAQAELSRVSNELDSNKSELSHKTEMLNRLTAQVDLCCSQLESTRDALGRSMDSVSELEKQAPSSENAVKSDTATEHKLARVEAELRHSQDRVSITEAQLESANQLITESFVQINRLVSDNRQLSDKQFQRCI